MATRDAVSTIRGYFYQFDYSILQVLRLENDTDTICVEGIEDVEITRIILFYINVNAMRGQNTITQR